MFPIWNKNNSRKYNIDILGSGKTLTFGVECLWFLEKSIGREGIFIVASSLIKFQHDEVQTKLDSCCWQN